MLPVNCWKFGEKKIIWVKMTFQNNYTILYKAAIPKNYTIQ